MIDIAIMVLVWQNRSAMSERTFQKRIRQVGLDYEIFQLPVIPYTFLPLSDIVWQLRHIYGWTMNEILTWFLTLS
jgi:hypothetical protein